MNYNNIISSFVEDSLDRVQNTLFQSSLGNAIHSLVTHVFFSDVGFTPYIDSWDHVSSFLVNLYISIIHTILLNFNF